MNKNIIILGPPGSGKGTQAKRLAEKLNLTYFGTGDLMREEIAKGTETGQMFDSFIKKGKLVPDNLIDQFLREKMVVFSDGGMVFDGFPRTIGQVELMEDVLPDKEFMAINIQVEPESLIGRMEKRRICDKCSKIYIVENSQTQKDCDACGGKLVKRSDDSREILAERIKVYEKQTAPIIDLFSQKGILINIDGEPPIEEVEKEIWKKVQK